MDEKHECGCRITWQEGMPEATWLRYCPKHKAAPDLAAALEDSLSALHFMKMHDHESGIPWPERLENAHAALAKARGEEATDG